MSLVFLEVLARMQALRGWTGKTEGAAVGPVKIFH